MFIGFLEAAEITHFSQRGLLISTMSDTSYKPTIWLIRLPHCGLYHVRVSWCFNIMMCFMGNSLCKASSIQTK